FRGRLIHFEIILLNKLLMLGLCNKAYLRRRLSFRSFKSQSGSADTLFYLFAKILFKTIIFILVF
ncbi:hypothetical protein ABTF33_04120, partial [Acinetobacter baumannii]|nr:hypothetical protein [Acinetobacter baumannii]MDC5128441.1 hypothetical protein [Acinetobacter baumannii]